MWSRSKREPNLGITVRRIRSAGFIISLELILITTILLIGSIVGVIAVRNALFQLRAAKAAFEVVVKDASDPPIRVKPVSYDLCEAPQILCRDFGYDENNLVVPGPSEGLNALVGVRPDRFVTRNQIYFTGDGCAGDAYLAAPAIPGSPNFPPTLPVGYYNCALQVDMTSAPVCYGVGPPASWPCLLGTTCTDGGRLYKNDGIVLASPAILSRWVSLNPDCALDPGPGSTDICDDTFETLAGELMLLPAIEVTDMAGDNVLAPFVPLMNVMAQDPTVTFLPTPGGPGTTWDEGEPPVDPDGPFPADATTDPDGGQPTMTPPTAEGPPP